MELEKFFLHQLLDSVKVARLALINRKNLPEAIPIVFGRHEDFLFSPVDGKPKRSSNLARIKNIKANSSTMLLLDYYSENWEELWWVRLVCESEVVSDPPHTDSYQTVLKAKYEQYQVTQLSNEVDECTFITFNIKSVSWWGFLGKHTLENWLAKNPVV